MKLKTALAIVFAVTVLPALPALAHDEWYSDHRAFHDELSEAHERAHEEGFWSRGEHRAYHRALRDLHGGYHEDHDDDAGYYYGPRRYYSYPSRYYSYPSYRSYGW